MSIGTRGSLLFAASFGTLKAALLKRAAGDFAGRAQGAFHFRLLAIYFSPRDGGCLGVFKFCFFSVHWFPIDFMNINPFDVIVLRHPLIK